MIWLRYSFIGSKVVIWKRFYSISLIASFLLCFELKHPPSISLLFPLYHQDAPSRLHLLTLYPLLIIDDLGSVSLMEMIARLFLMASNINWSALRIAKALLCRWQLPKLKMPWRYLKRILWQLWSRFSMVDRGVTPNQNRIERARTCLNSDARPPSVSRIVIRGIAYSTSSWDPFAGIC